MWKIQTAQIWEEIYNSVLYHGLFLEEQKRYYRETKGTADLLYID